MQVGHRVQRGHQMNFLMDRDDARCLRLGGVTEGRDPAAHFDHAGIRLIDAGQNLDQRALPRAVLAQKRVDFARPQVKVHIGQRQHAVETFFNARETG